MLPAAHRLRSAAQFRDTTRRGGKAVQPSVIAYVLLPAAGVPPHPPAAVGLIVSKSVGGSVVRHRAARRLRACALPLLSALPDGASVVLRALPGAAQDKGLPTQVAVAVEQALDHAQARRR